MPIILLFILLIKARSLNLLPFFVISPDQICLKGCKIERTLGLEGDGYFLSVFKSLGLNILGSMSFLSSAIFFYRVQISQNRGSHTYSTQRSLFLDLKFFSEASSLSLVKRLILFSQSVCIFLSSLASFCNVEQAQGVLSQISSISDYTLETLDSSLAASFSMSTIERLGLSSAFALGLNILAFNISRVSTEFSFIYSCYICLMVVLCIYNLDICAALFTQKSLSISCRYLISVVSLFSTVSYSIFLTSFFSNLVSYLDQCLSWIIYRLSRSCISTFSLYTFYILLTLGQIHQYCSTYAASLVSALRRFYTSYSYICSCLYAFSSSFFKVSGFISGSVIPYRGFYSTFIELRTRSIFLTCLLNVLFFSSNLSII